jgi:2-dehydro-3-deoxyphosphogalactonate aldolase
MTTAHRHIIAILRGIEPDEAVAVSETLVRAGITLIEVPLNSPRPFDSIQSAARALHGKASVGAGTVLSEAEADAVADVGAAFIVSPDCNEAVIARTLARGLRSYPGVFSPTEAFGAIRAGAHGLKIFPAELVGPVGIKALSAVLPPAVPLYAVGGANPENFAAYIAAGATGFGIGSYLYKPRAALADIEARAKAVVAAYDKATTR